MSARLSTEDRSSQRQGGHEHGIGFPPDPDRVLGIDDDAFTKTGFEEWRHMRTEMLAGMQSALTTMENL